MWFLSVIKNPGLGDTACDFSLFAIPLFTGSDTCIGPPNLPNYNLGSLAGSLCDSLTAVKEISENSTITISSNPVTQYGYVVATAFNNGDIFIYDLTGRLLFQSVFKNK